LLAVGSEMRFCCIALSLLAKNQDRSG